MELRVLGPLEVCVGGIAVPLGAPKQQTVLALLTVNAGRVVGLDELVDELWPEHPPASAVENVRSYAASVRRLFDSVELGGNRITKRSSGYLFAAAPNELDLLAFLEDSGSGRAAVAGGDLSSAADKFTSARSLWRGRMLAGVPCGPVLTARCAAMEEERLSLTEDHAGLELALGQPARAVVALREHVRAHPLRERGHGLLMRALYQSGDIAGALSGYATARRTLINELGVEPGPDLQRIHAAVLRRDPELDGPGTGHISQPPGRPAAVLVPRELPPDIGCFVGRKHEIEQLCHTLTPTADRPLRRRPTVTILYGQGGVGKSALAVHVAHQMAGEYADGQLYLDLFGSTPGLRPLSSVEALGSCLRSLGVPRDEIPDVESDAATRFRTVTTGRRLLLVLDNAIDASQIIPLIPANERCGVLVTAREPLGVIDADSRLRVAALSADDGTALLCQLTDELSVDNRAAETIANLCEGLPLAIRIAAGRLIGRPDLPPRELAARLADRRRRLDELELDGLGVRSSIRVGYESLASDPHRITQLASRAFRVLGLLNVPDVRADVVAAMLGLADVDVARAALDRLVAAQLVGVAAGGRYRLHDLVRLVAAELAAEEDDAASRERSLHRAMSYYLACLTRAEDLIRPGRTSYISDPLLEVDEVAVNFSSPAEAHSWVAAELPSLLSAAEQASNLPGPARRFTLWIVYWTSTHLYNRLELGTARHLSRLVLDTAERHRDREMEGWAHLLLGRSEAELCNLSSALQHFEHARPLLTETSRFGTAFLLNAFGGLAHRANRQSEALARFQECLEFVRRYGLVSMEAAEHFNIGNAYAALDRWAEAQHHLERSLDIRRGLNDRSGIGASLCILAIVHCQNGEFQKALSCVDEGMRCTREIGDRLRECQSLLIATEICLRDGRHEESLAWAEVLLQLSRDYEYRYAEAAGLRQQAKALGAVGRSAHASELMAEAEQAFSLVTGYRDPVIDLFLASVSHP